MKVEKELFAIINGKGGGMGNILCCLEISDWINLSVSILSFLLATISVVTVVITLLQNKKMIESSYRPYVVIYGDATNFSDIQFYIILKNFGKSGAIIRKLSCDKDLSKYSYGTTITPFECIENTLIAPNQNIVCSIDHQQLNKDNIDVLNFTIEYEFCGKVYKENCPVNYNAFRKNLTTKSATKDKELRTISYTLQEMVQKDL